jgi:hypothetical protein
MDLSSVNPVGVLAFSFFKFAGYVFLFLFLKRKFPALQASVVFMAAVRALLGLLAGGALYFAWDAARHHIAAFYNLSYEMLPYYAALFVLRVFVWAATIYLFVRATTFGKLRLLQYALLGAFASSLMDIPAALLTIFVPGAVLFC